MHLAIRRARSRARFAAAAAIVLGIVAVTTVATATVYPSPAYAATPDDYSGVGAGGDVNFLPSAQGLTSGGTAAQRLNARAQAAYASMKTAAQQIDVDEFIRRNGIGTSVLPFNLDKLEGAEAVKGLKTTSFLGRGLAVLGPVGDVIGAYYLGTQITNHGAKIFGLDPSGYVCENTGEDVAGQLVRIVDGSLDCPDMNFDATFVPNKDVTGGLSGRYCSAKPGEGCMELIGSQPWGESTAYCMVITGATDYQGASVNVPIVYTVDPDGYYATSAWAYSREGGANGRCPVPAQGTWSSVINPNPGNVLKSFAYGTGASASTPTPVTNSSGNPERTLKCYVKGTDGKTYEGKGTTYRDTDKHIDIPACMKLPDGVLPENTTIKRSTDGGKQDETLNSFDTDPAVLDWAKKYPTCTMYSLCNLSLQKANGTGWSTCVDTSTACEDWYTDPDKSTAYRCVYGVPGDQKPVSLSECDVYQHRFTADAQGTGDTITDPETGDQLENPSPGHNPNSDEGAANAPVDDGEKRKGCFPSGWGLVNPFAWMKLGQCLINWAVIPRPSEVRKATTGMQDAWKDTGPAKVADAVTGWDFEPRMTGCGGIAYPANLIYKGQPPGSFLNACPGSGLEGLATTSRVLLDIMFGIGAAWAIARYISATIGYTGPAE